LCHELHFRNRVTLSREVSPAIVLAAVATVPGAMGMGTIRLDCLVEIDRLFLGISKASLPTFSHVEVELLTVKF